MTAFYSQTYVKVSNGYILTSESQMFPQLNRVRVALELDKLVGYIDEYAAEFEIALADARKRAAEKSGADVAAPLTAPTTAAARKAPPPAPKAAATTPAAPAGKTVN